MVLFGKKKKDYLQINKKTKSAIFSELQKLQLDSKISIDAKTLIRSMQSQISFQSDSNSEEVDKIDTEILKSFKKARSLFSKGQNAVALAELRLIAKKIKGRAKYCKIAGTVIEIDNPVIKTQAEKLQDQIDEKYSDLVVCQKSFDEAKKKCLLEVDNELLKSQLCNIKIKIDELSNDLALLMEELSNEVAFDSNEQIELIRKELERSRKYTQIEVEFMTAEYKKQQEALEALHNQNLQDTDLITQ